MTSKISYIKLIKEDLRQRSWLVAILTITLFLFQPLMLVISISEKKKWLLNKAMDFSRKDFREWLIDFMGFQNNALSICIVLFAILCGISGYCYLHSKEKLDLIHSLPIRREKLFCVQFISGILIFILPLTFNLLISLLSISFQGLLSHRLIVESFTAFFIYLLYFLYLYVITIFSMIITGKILVGILAAITISSYGSLVLSLLRLLATTFFSTYFSDTVYYNYFYVLLHTNGNDGFSSPIMAYMTVLNQIPDGKKPWLLITVSVLMTVILLFVTILLYRRRPTEKAGTSIVFPLLEPVIKILISVPLGILAAFYLNYLSNQDLGSITLFVLAILFTFIFGTIVEFIYTLDVKHLFHRKISNISLILSVLLALIITGIYKFDLLKFDNYIPKKNEIESMSVYMEDFGTRFNYPFLGDSGSRKDFLDRSALSKFDSVYDMAEVGAATYDMDDEYARSVNIKYSLKNGRSVYRNYLINREKLQSCLKDILNSREYKEYLFDTKKYESLKKIGSVEISDIYQNSDMPQLTDTQIHQLLEIYQKELLEASYHDLMKEFPVGSIAFIADRNNSYTSRPLYKSFTKTYDYLKKLGYTFPMELDVENISTIEVYNYDTSKKMTFQTPEEIGEILPELTPTPIYHPNIPLGIDVILKNESSGFSRAFHLKSEHIPKCLRELL